jgi:hypothetical protein
VGWGGGGGAAGVMTRGARGGAKCRHSKARHMPQQPGACCAVRLTRFCVIWMSTRCRSRSSNTSSALLLRRDVECDGVE